MKTNLTELVNSLASFVTTFMVGIPQPSALTSLNCDGLTVLLGR
jgi:hypothetical protein